MSLEEKVQELQGIVLALNARLRALEDQWQAIARVFVAPPTTPTPVPKSAPVEQPPKAQGMFKEETVKYTLAQLDGSIKPIHYIADAALFGRISDDLKAHGFHWVSEGKNSRWIK